MAEDLDHTLQRQLRALADGRRSALGRLLEELLDRWEARDPALDDLLEAVVASAQTGNDLALELVLSAVHQLGLARPAITRLVVDPETIDDLAQSALVKVELNLDRFEGRSKFRTWVHSIARNEALMHLRRQRGDVDALDADDDTPDLSPRLSTVIAGRATLRQALDGLPEPYRSTMVMRVDEELDYQQIADQLSVPVGTIRSRLAKARELLGEALLVA